MTGIKNIDKLDFEKVYKLFIQKRNMPYASGKSSIELLEHILDELKIKAANNTLLLERLVLNFSKRQLPGKKFTKYNKLNIEYLKPKDNILTPENVKVNIKSCRGDFDATIKSLSKIVAKDVFRRNMEAVLLNTKDNEIVATDASVLVMIPFKLSGKETLIIPKITIDKKLKLYKNKYEIIDERFPDYKSVIPSYKLKSRTFDINQLLSEIKAVERLSEFFNEKDKFLIKLNADKQQIYFQPDKLIRTLYVMTQQETEEIRFLVDEEKAQSRALFIVSEQNKKLKSIVMPFLVSEGGQGEKFIEYDLQITKNRITKSKEKKDLDFKTKKSKALKLRAKAIKIKLQLAKY